MKPIYKTIAQGALAVVIYDIVASIVSKYSGVPYARFTAGSLILYAAVGFFAARNKARRSLGLALLAGAVTGIVDASAGWTASSWVGPVVPAQHLTPLLWFIVAVIVVVSATILAAIGYAIGRFIVFRNPKEAVTDKSS